MSVIGGQNPIVQDGLVYILDFGNERSYTSGSNTAQSLIYNPVTASFVAPPAGDYSGLAAAYSVRRVVSSYSGPAMEVQSGSVSASIGFDSLGNLDTASLEAFAGSGDAFVKTWYDQSGNGRHASQAVTSSQPQVVSGGVVVLQNGNPTIQFDGINDNLISNSFTAISQPFTTFSVNKFITANNAAGANAPFVFDLGTDRSLQLVTAPNKYYVYFGEYLISTLGTDFSNYQLHYILAKSTTSEIKIDSESIISGNLGTGTASRITIGSRGGSAYFSNQFFSEFIFYASDQSTNRLNIESNINSYYNIYTSSFSPTPGFDTNKIDLSRTTAVDTNQSFPGFSYDQGNLTLIFTGETKTNSPLFTQADQISIVGTTSSIGYGSPTNNLGRTFPASGFDHISLRFTTGSVDCFVNGIPTAPNSIFPTGSFGTGDFIASNYSGSLGNLLVYNRELSDDEIYAIYSQQARRYGLIEQDKPYTVDSSVYAYTQAAGITGSSVITALDAFVVGLKANNLWNKMIAIYPFLGSDTVKTRYNLKDSSLNTTAITYSGSWSASDSGSYNNNTSSYGILENITPSYFHPLVNTQSFHMTYLSYDTPVSGGFAIGATNQAPPPPDPPVIASGGQVFDISGSRVHVFTASGDFTVTQGVSVQAFVVAGGGGGGNYGGGGGGAGGVISNLNKTISSRPYTITVGNGGLKSTSNLSGNTNGENSVFDDLIAIGGGRGSLERNSVGQNGGSGGGGTNTGAGGTATSGQGNNGGGGNGSNFRGGGGGGAGSVGETALTGRAGNGGSGSYYAQYAPLGFGSPAGWFAGGGGGGGNIGTLSLGGIGGGGQGNNVEQTLLATDGATNTGGGGGASYLYNASNGGNGGSGIVIISYLLPFTGSTFIQTTPTFISASANDTAGTGLTTGGPLGMITVSRTGSTSMALWKNRVPTKSTTRASASINLDLYLNGLNASNNLVSASQNNIAYASVGAGLTDDEVYTYYELVDELQTELGRGVTDPNAFITTWDTRITGTGTVTGTSSIALPLFGTQAITASWGDGTVSLISQSAQADRTHSYAEPGIYTVTVTGQSAGFFERYSADKAKLLDIVQWGTVAPPYLTGYSLTGAENLVGTYTDKAPILGGNFRFFLDGATKFNGWANDWDMTGVTSLQSIFNGTRFNQPVDQWVFNPSGVSFNATFNATPFDQNVSAWDVRPVTSFYRAFRGSNFNNGGSPDINNWVFVSASGFTEMFGDKFNQNIGNWDVSKVAGTGSNQSFFSMFKDAVSFNNGGSPDINNWRFNTSSDITMYGMFENADAFNQPIGNWNTERVVSMGWMFHGIQIFDQNIGAWNVEKVISFNSMFGRSGRTSPAFNNGGSPDINNWRPISCSDFNSMFYNAPSFDQPIGNWPLSASNIDMGSMFNGNNSTTKFNQNIGAWDVSRVVNMSSMFFNNNQFNNSGSSDINNWRPISCSGFGGMFYNATAFNQPIGNWPLSASNINMSNMFRNADAFNQNIGAWNVEKVTNMSSMFNGNRDFNNSGSSDINNWTPVSCSDFISMFAGATAFNQPIENWTLPTDRTFTMTSMFNGATAFNQSLGNWNIVSASSMTSMLNSSAIDIPNYTKTLRGWGNLANTTGVQTAVPLGASGKKYGAAHAQRKVLTDTYGWTITDGGQEPFVFTINTTASGIQQVQN
jgi:surface protein